MALKKCPHCQFNLTSHKEEKYILERQRTREAARNLGENNRFNLSKPLAKLHKEADKISDLSGGVVEVITLAVKYTEKKKMANLFYSSTSEALTAIAEEQGLKRVAEVVVSKFVEKLIEDAQEAERQNGTQSNIPNQEEALDSDLEKWLADNNLLDECKSVFARAKLKMHHLSKLTEERLLKLGLPWGSAIDVLDKVNGQ